MTPYPESTELKNNLSIFHLALRHQVEYQTFKDFYNRLERQGWQLHEYLETTPYSERQLQRAFLPQMIFTPYAHESLFGKTWMDEVKGKSPAEKRKAVLKERLNPDSKICRHTENLLLTQKDNVWLNCPLHLTIKERTFVFTIEWADLWLFNDNTGVLAFKTKLEQVQKGDKYYSPSVDDLNTFNRSLRYSGGALGSSKEDTVYHADDPAQICQLWDELVYEQWLGFANQNVLMLDETSQDIFDRYSRYSKLLTVAQIPDVQAGEAEFIWSKPLIHPDLIAPANYTALADNQWLPAFNVYQRAMLSDYATVREMLLLELATTSDEGKSWSGDRNWQYEPSYVKKLFVEGGIKVWRYWEGLALRDVCAFMVYDDSMPLLRKQQAESYYYPLYVHTYHQRFRLDCFSQEIIDHGLHDCVKARKILEEFHAFHNQYWFKEATVDFQGVEIAARMKEGLAVEKKYQVVKEEVKEVSSFIDTKVQAGRQTVIALLILAFYPFQYFGIGKWLAPFVSDLGGILSINGIFLAIVLSSWLLLPRLLGPFCKLFAKLYHRTTE